GSNMKNRVMSALYVANRSREQAVATLIYKVSGCFWMRTNLTNASSFSGIRRAAQSRKIVILMKKHNNLQISDIV
ncbi:MAG: hypothetical protein ABIR00_00905, partial [Nitrosospira sp.]